MSPPMKMPDSSAAAEFSQNSRYQFGDRIVGRLAFEDDIVWAGVNLERRWWARALGQSGRFSGAPCRPQDFVGAQLDRD